MPKSKKHATPDAFAFLAGLQSLLDSLPSLEQRAEAQAAFDELIRFLSDARDKFLALPTKNEAADLKQSLIRLEELFLQAEQNPTIAQSIGLRSEASKAKSRAIAAAKSEIDADAEAKTIRRLSAEEMRSRLDDKRYSVQDMRAIAQALGLKSGSKESKKVLAGRIVNHIETDRMSDRLAGRTDSKWTPTEQDETTPKDGFPPES